MLSIGLFYNVLYSKREYTTSFQQRAALCLILLLPQSLTLRLLSYQALLPTPTLVPPLWSKHGPMKIHSTPVNTFMCFEVMAQVHVLVMKMFFSGEYVMLVL